MDIKLILKAKSVEIDKFKTEKTLHYNENKIITDDEAQIDNIIKDIPIKYEIFKNILYQKVINPINL